MGAKFLFGKLKNVLEMNSGDEAHGNVDALNATELYTESG